MSNGGARIGAKPNQKILINNKKKSKGKKKKARWNNQESEQDQVIVENTSKGGGTKEKKPRGYGHGNKHKIRIAPKSRKTKCNSIPNLQTTNPLCLDFGGITEDKSKDNHGSAREDQVKYKEIQAMESPYLNWHPITCLMR